MPKKLDLPPRTNAQCKPNATFRSACVNVVHPKNGSSVVAAITNQEDWLEQLES